MGSAAVAVAKSQYATVTNANLTAPGAKSIQATPAGSPNTLVTAAGLYPFIGTYGIYGGQCLTNDPSKAPTSSLPLLQTFSPTPNQTFSPNPKIRVPSINVRVVNAARQRRGGRRDRDRQDGGRRLHDHVPLASLGDHHHGRPGVDPRARIPVRHLQDLRPVERDRVPTATPTSAPERVRSTTPSTPPPRPLPKRSPTGWTTWSRTPAQPVRRPSTQVRSIPTRPCCRPPSDRS